MTYNEKTNKHNTNKFIKNKHNRFHIQIEDELLNGGPCHTWRSGETLPMVRLSMHKLIVYLDAVVGVELLATTLAGKHIAIVLLNFVLAK